MLRNLPLSPAPTSTSPSFLQRRAHMFHRSQAKKQGFAKEQRTADAQLASLRQLGLISPDKKGFASAWGGTELIPSGSAARTGTNLHNHHTTSNPSQLGSYNDGPSFPKKGELCLYSDASYFFFFFFF